MGDKLYVITYLITYIFQTYVIFRLMRVFLGKPKGYGAEAAAYVCYYICITCVYLRFELPWLNFAANILLLLGITLIYTRSLWSGVKAVASVYMLMLGTETAVLVIVGYVRNSFLGKTEFDSVVGLVLLCLLSCMAMEIVSHFHELGKQELDAGKYGFCLLIVPAVSIYLVINMGMQPDKSRVVTVINILLVLLLNFIVFFLYNALVLYMRKQNASIRIEDANERYESEVRIMSESLEAMRILRHDLKNHMIALTAMAENKEYESLCEYIRKFTGEISEKEPFSTGNIELDAILCSKMEEARSMEIRIDVNASVPSKMNLNGFDLSALLGNLLDNSINGVRELNEEHRWISADIRMSRNRLFLMIRNPYEGELHWHNGRLQTNKKDKELHGLGLQSVKRTIEKYGGEMDIETEDHIFKVKIMIYITS